MQILITGATGFIGRHLVEHFRDNGCSVRILTRNTDRAKHLFGDEVKYFPWRADGIPPEAVESVDTVIHLAGEPIAPSYWTKSKKSRILNSRVNGGETLTHCIRSVENKPRLLVQASAIGFYGPNDTAVLDENSPPGNDYLSRVAQAWERSTSPVEEMGVTRIVLRFGLVLGKDGGVFPYFRLPFRFFLGGPIGKGTQWISWVHIEDVVSSIQCSIENNDRSGIFNVTAPHPVTNKRFSKVLGEVLKRPSWFPVPSFVVRLVLGEMGKTLILTGQNVEPKRLLETGFSYRFSDLTQALSSLC